MLREVIPLGSSPDQPTEPLNIDEAWLGGSSFARNGVFCEAGDEPDSAR